MADASMANLLTRDVLTRDVLTRDVLTVDEVDLEEVDLFQRSDVEDDEEISAVHHPLSVSAVSAVSTAPTTLPLLDRYNDHRYNDHRLNDPPPPVPSPKSAGQWYDNRRYFELVHSFTPSTSFIVHFLTSSLLDFTS